VKISNQRAQYGLMTVVRAQLSFAGILEQDMYKGMEKDIQKI
jgi:hypothetical protein